MLILDCYFNGPMTAAWTIRSRRGDSDILRRSSLSSLPDLSDGLEINRLSSNLYETPHCSAGQPFFPESANIKRSQSNASVSFLGRRITREYRSAFLLSDAQTVGVTRQETFHPEKATADVRVS